MHWQLKNKSVLVSSRSSTLTLTAGYDFCAESIRCLAVSTLSFPWNGSSFSHFLLIDMYIVDGNWPAQACSDAAREGLFDAKIEELKKLKKEEDAKEVQRLETEFRSALFCSSARQTYSHKFVTLQMRAAMEIAQRAFCHATCSHACQMHTAPWPAPD